MHAYSFGPDGHIYITTGDKGATVKAKQKRAGRLKFTAGKVIRVKTDGSFPTDNLGVTQDGVGGDIHDGIWASGIRNGYRSRWDLSASPPRYYIANVGGNQHSFAWESIYLGAPGADYGWPHCEGSACASVDSTFAKPLYTWPHGGSSKEFSSAIIGGFVYRGTAFPSVSLFAPFPLENVAGGHQLFSIVR